MSFTTNETINKICLEPIESGPCRAAIEMFAFSVDQWRCIKFIYSGCQGNSNRFASVEECEAVDYFQGQPLRLTPFEVLCEPSIYSHYLQLC
ncbi:unnamed protein product [Schistosoma turkestanicum]|nr:unnamed protein product [Schistosoma turkestanicum]